MEEIHFVYASANGCIGSYTLRNRSEQGAYIQGYSSSSHGLRTFRKNRVIQYFESYSEALAFVEKIRSDPDYKLPAVVESLDFNGVLEICFTGFKKDDKKRLSAMASDAGMLVRKDVTSNLHVLCGGYNAGPVKLELARMKGSMILSEQQLLALIETGELPDNYGDQ